MINNDNNEYILENDKIILEKNENIQLPLVLNVDKEFNIENYIILLEMNKQLESEYQKILLENNKLICDLKSLKSFVISSC